MPDDTSMTIPENQGLVSIGLGDAAATTFSTARTVDFVLMGKGGVGKSVVAGMLAQQLLEIGSPVICIDADPINNTLSGVSAYGADVIDLLDDETINIPDMDAMITRIVETDANFIVDPGASGFVPVLSYMLKDELFQLISSSGKVVRAHAIIIGGESMADTVSALDDMIKQLPACVEIIVWLNPHFGPLINNGVEFEHTPFWQKRGGLVAGVVRLPTLDRAAGLAIRKLLTARKTFSEASTSGEFNLVEKQRLARIWQPIRLQIAGI